VKTFKGLLQASGDATENYPQNPAENRFSLAIL
jgi:hypothetical protein